MSNPLRVTVVGVFVWALAFAALNGQSTNTPPPAAQAGAIVAGTVVDVMLQPLAGVTVALSRDGREAARTTTNAEGAFRFERIAVGTYTVRAERAGFTTLTREVTVRSGARSVQLPLVLEDPNRKTMGEITVDGIAPTVGTGAARSGGVAGGTVGGVASAPPPPPPSMPPPPPVYGAGAGVGGGRGGQMGEFRAEPSARPLAGEEYGRVVRNRFRRTTDEPLSTFGADVDTASFTNVRRFLSSGQLPPVDAVRVEELVNYFRFNYAQPRGADPIGMTTEVGDCPWAPGHKLVLVGARARASENTEVAGRSIVLLIDVSGSMAPPERLPLIKTALNLFVDTLRPDDRLAIVTYAGTSGIALRSTSMRERDVVHRAIDSLSAGGSTNGGQGLILAYRTARQAFIPGGVNRVILASDGDFNVGITDHRDLQRLIERERESGVFLSVFGVGSGNLKDARMEMLADRGNGHYAYIDSLQEARRVLIRESDATLETVAKDVKFQVEFNPAAVTAWKLIGYENRLLASRDFNDDRKDGGEMGAGHTVTVLYEIVPAGAPYPDNDRADDRPDVDPLKYQPASDTRFGNELMNVKVRYKLPDAEESALMTHAVRAGGRAQHLPFAAAVAEFGMLLRDGRAPLARWDALARRTRSLADRDAFVELVELAAGLRRLDR